MTRTMDTAASLATLDALLGLILRTTGLRLSYRAVANAEGAVPRLIVEFSGPDVAVLLARNAELLLALEHLATQALGLEPAQHDLLSFDAAGFKTRREADLDREAVMAVAAVRATGTPFAFRPMSSRERRLLHLKLAASGLRTASEGEGSQRHLVLYPD